MLYVFVTCCYFFVFNDTATPEIYTYLHTLSLHDALPSSAREGAHEDHFSGAGGALSHGREVQSQEGRQGRHRLRPLEGRDRRGAPRRPHHGPRGDRKSTRLNSSH